MSNILDLRPKLLRKQLSNPYVPHKLIADRRTGEITSSRTMDELTRAWNERTANEYAARLQRIKAALDNINRLMTDLKEIERQP